MLQLPDDARSLPVLGLCRLEDGQKAVRDELTNGGSIKFNNKLFPVVYFLIKYVAPVTIAVIFITGLVG